MLMIDSVWFLEKIHRKSFLVEISSLILPNKRKRPQTQCKIYQKELIYVYCIMAGLDKGHKHMTFLVSLYTKPFF